MMITAAILVAVFLHTTQRYSREWMYVGETYILYNQQMKGKRELIQLGAPIFGQIKEEANPKDGNSKTISSPSRCIYFTSLSIKLPWHF